MSDDRSAGSPKARCFRACSGQGRQPLRLVAVPRDHVLGDRARGDALLGGRAARLAARKSLSPTSTSPSSERAGPLAREVQGFAWLRDLAASASREKGARLAEAIAGRWLIAHGTRVDEAWAPELWGERILFWTAYAPYILSSRDAGYRSALLNTLARGARHLDATADKAPPGLPRITAWAGALVASLTVQGAHCRACRVRESGLMRALAGGPVRGWRADEPQPAGADAAGRPPRPGPRGLFRGQADPARCAGKCRGGGAGGASWRHHGRRCVVAAGRAAIPAIPARLAALVEGCGLRARPLRQARGWGYQRLSRARHDHRRRRRAAAAAEDGADRLRLDAGDRNERRRPAAGRQLRRARPGRRPRCRRELVAGAAHRPRPIRRWSSNDTNSTAILPDGTLGQGRRPTSRSSAARTMTARGSRPATTAMSRASAWSTSAASASATTARKCAARTG